MQTLKTIYNFNTFLPNVPFDPPENIGKPKVFWRFQGDQKRNLQRKWLNLLSAFLSNFYFSANDSPSKTMKNVISSKKLFLFSMYSKKI